MNVQANRLQARVLDALRWDASVEAAEIGVSVHEGVITLSGYVDTFPEGWNAARIAKRVFGANAVANEIEVRIKGEHEHTDTEIAEAALNALQWDSTVPDNKIKLSVAHGMVTLDGTVDWKYQREAAESTVRYLNGVRGVKNQVTVKARLVAKDVAAKIEGAFQRSAVIDARRITVETHDGSVTLRGKVHSWAERDEAERAVWSAPGVREVENRLAVL